jgi:hypothetical protein
MRRKLGLHQRVPIRTPTRTLLLGSGTRFSTSALFIQQLRPGPLIKFFFSRISLLRIRENSNQGCGSGSGLDPDTVTLWIRISIGLLGIK